MSVIGSNVLAGASGSAGGAGYAIERSLRFNSADSAYLNRTPSSAGNRKTWTWSGWLKRSGLGTYTSVFGGSSASPSTTTQFFFGFDTNDKLIIQNAAAYYRITNQVFRDTSAWQHIVVALDTSQSTASDRIKLYVNGSQVTSFSYSADPTQNQDLGVNQAETHKIGNDPGTNAYWYNGYLADVHFIDGQAALTPTDFGETDNNGVWQPKKYSGSYGTNGFRLKFADNSGATATTLGKDTSGGSNNWTPNNLSVTAGAVNDSLLDTPTNGDTASDTGAGGEITGCYATLNPLYTSVAALSNGNLLYGGGSGQHCVGSTFAVKSSKWYWESTVESGGTYYYTGIADSNTAFATNWCGSSTGWSVSVNTSGNISYNNTENHGNIGTSPSTGQVWGWALDMDAGTLKVYIDGVIQYSGNSIIPSSTSLSGRTVTPATGHTTGKHLTYNFGQRPFAYPRSGYKSLNTANLPTPTIADGSKYFDIALDTGANILSAATGKTDNAGLVWIKDRANSSTNHILFNKVNDAGMDGTPHLRSNEPDTEATCGTYSAPSGNSVGWVWDAGANSDKTYAITVANPGSGNKYYADGALQPTLTLEEGSTYKFDQSAATNSGHPLRFSTTSDGTHGGGSEYTTGVTTAGTPGSAGAYTQIVIAAGAPTLYAYCTNHSGMGFQVNTTVANPVSLWSTGATKYIGIKFASASGGTVHYGQTSGSTTVQVWTSSDNSYWTQQGGTQTLSTGHTLTTSDQYVYIRNTSDATFTNWYSAASNGADGHYSSATYPSGASWTGPAYTDHDFRGGGTLIAAGSISSGVPTLPSIVRANPSAGFSIVSFNNEGAACSVGHGLNAKPSLILAKNRNAVNGWYVYHESVGANVQLQLSTTGKADGPNSTIWQNVEPTSDVFYLGTGGLNYQAGLSTIAYCFAPVEGYSAMGSYIGNGLANGIFIYTGFSPRWLLFKRSDSTSDWTIYDTARDPHNVSGIRLRPNLANNDHDERPVLDILSNGFKFRRNSYENGGNDQYLYVAFASHPFASNGGLAR